MKYYFHLRIILLFILALIGTITGCSNNLSLAPRPVSNPTATSTSTPSPPTNTPSAPTFTNTGIFTNTFTYTQTPTLTPAVTATCAYTPVLCSTVLPPVYPYGWIGPIYEQESACVSGTNDTCATAQNIGGVCTSGLYVLGYLSSVGSGSYAGSDKDFYTYTESCFGTWHLLLDCTNGSAYQVIMDPCGASPVTYNSGYEAFTGGGGGGPITVEVVGSSGSPGPYRLCIWREGMPTLTPTFTYTPTGSPTPTWTSTGSPSPSVTVTNTFTVTSCCTMTYTPTPTYTSTAMPTATCTMTATRTWTNTQTPTGTWPTWTPTWTFTVTNTRTPTWTPANTLTPNATATGCVPSTLGDTQTPYNHLFSGSSSTGFLVPYLVTSSMTVYTITGSLYNPRPNAQCQFAVYSDNGSGSMPVSLLSQSNPQAWSAAGWVTAPLLTPVSVVAGNYYWLAVVENGDMSMGGPTLPYQGFAVWPVGSFPANASTDPNFYIYTNYTNFSLYASGCPVSPITYTPTPTNSYTYTPTFTPTGTWPTYTPTPTFTHTWTVTATPT